MARPRPIALSAGLAVQTGNGQRELSGVMIVGSVGKELFTAPRRKADPAAGGENLPKRADWTPRP
jgi:hypothetical protein